MTVTPAPPAAVMSSAETSSPFSNLARLADDFVPRRFLRGGHAQTVAGNFLRRANHLPPPEEQLCEIEPGVRLLCHCHWQPRREERLTLLIVHGLEGSSSSRYVIGTGSRAWRRGWNLVRMNIRGCGGTERYSSTLYHSGLSQDVEKLVAWLTTSAGIRRVALVGFSMGGNQVLRALGRWGAKAPPQVVCAAAVSPSCNLALSSDRIHEPHNRLYEWWFLQSLRRSYRRKAALWPGNFDPSLLRHVRSVRDFDEHITARYMGFAGADDYYDKASSSHVLERIARPTLVIHADDDPFIVLNAESRRKLATNPNIAFLNPKHGGHCAFLDEPAADGSDDGHWAERKIIEFLAQLDAATAR
jgi:predicted alpha/beta-fold hydrolase